MERSPERSEATNDLLTVTISFVLYMTMLLVLVAIQAQPEEGAPDLPRGWALGHILALLLLILGAGHLIGARVLEHQRKLRLLLTASEVLSAASLFLLSPRGWVWLIPAAGAFGAWAFCFQWAVLEFMESGEEPPEEPLAAEPLEPLCEPGAALAEPPAAQERSPEEPLEDRFT